jgi:hypothetical protein
MEAISRLEGLTATSWTRSRGEGDNLVASLEYDSTGAWLKDEAHLAAFVVVAESSLSAVRELIRAKVDGVEPEEFLAAVFTLLRDKFK